MIPKSKPFRFKQFSIYQEQSAMKVGTDAVILGAYTSIQRAKSILDIGCGTALLSLMLAQKSSAKIIAIELDEKAVEEARLNVAISPWPKQIKVIKEDFIIYAKTENNHFDLIICNPPFFRGENRKDSRTLARQNNNLPFEKLFIGVDKLLSKEGFFWGIFPLLEKDYLFSIFKSKALFVRKILFIQGNENTATKRFIVCLSKKEGEVVEEKLIIEKSRNVYTSECMQLLKPYLLFL